MRTLLLGFIFLLLLTLGNAWLFRKNAQVAVAHDYAPLQLTQRSATRLEWDAFVWREIAAVIVTAVVFAAIGAAARRTTRPTNGSSSRPR